MIISGLFDLVDTYFVNSYITDQYSQSTCNFDHGLVAFFGESAPSRNSIAPAALWPLSFLAVRALSFTDEGQRGVYSKVDLKFNNKETIFSPSKADVLGYWKCSNESNIDISPDDINNGTAVDSAIHKQNFLYTEATASATTFAGSTVSEVMFWSANHNESSTWEMKATMGVNISQTHQATNYHCIYGAKRTWNAPIIELQASLDEWKGLMVGYLVDSSIEFSNHHIEIMLNAMTMVAASGNSLYYANNKRFKELNSRDKSYGCVKKHAEVENPVWAVFFIMVLVVIGLVVVVDLYKLIRYKTSSRSKTADKMPFEMMDWQLATMQHLTGKENLEYRDLKDYEYFHDRSIGRNMVRKRQQVRVLIFLLPRPLSSALGRSKVLLESFRTIKKRILDSSKASQRKIVPKILTQSLLLLFVISWAKLS